MIKKLIIPLLFIICRQTFASEFVVKDISTAQDIRKIRGSSIILITPGDENKIYQYCHETDKERQYFFSFKSKFFAGFESRLHQNSRDQYGYPTGNQTIGGFKVDTIQYDIYDNKIARIDITIITRSADQSQAIRIFEEALTQQFGEPSGYHTWNKHEETLSFKYDITTGNTHIHIENKSVISKANSLISNACFKHENDDIKDKIKDF